MGLNKKAQDYLDKCRVIGPTEVKEGIVVSSSPSADFKVSIVTVKKSDVNEELIDEFNLFDFFDEDESKKILNFKKTIAEIVGRKQYYLETNVYNYLANIDGNDEFNDWNFDDAEERARHEAEEEEEAEHNFERFLKAQEEL